MAKHTKEERKQIRAQGRQQVKYGMAEYRRNKPDTTKGGRLGISGGKPSIEVNWQDRDTADKKENRREAVKQIAKGVVKAIFNAPSWWKNDKPGAAAYPKLPMNVNRPFNPDGVAAYFSSIMNGSAPMLSYVNLELHDLTQSTAFNVAMGDFFRDLREKLGKNFNYSETAIKDIVAASMCYAARFTEISRKLAWYDYTRYDNPNMRSELQRRTASAYDSGLIDTVATPLTETEGAYAASLSTYPILRETVAKLRLPAAMLEFIQWLIGYYYADMAGTNPQIYAFDLRKCPMYKFDTDTMRVEYVGAVDLPFFDTDLASLVHEIEAFLSVFGEPLADIQRYFDWIAPTAPFDPEVDSSLVLRCDAEIFNAILNGYSSDPTPAEHNDVIRLDFLPEVYSDDQTHVIGSLALLGSVIANSDVTLRFGSRLLSVISQSFFVSSSAPMDYPNNVDVVIDMQALGSQTKQYDAWETLTGNHAYQFGTDVDITSVSDAEWSRDSFGVPGVLNISSSSALKMVNPDFSTFGNIDVQLPLNCAATIAVEIPYDYTNTYVDFPLVRSASLDRGYFLRVNDFGTDHQTFSVIYKLRNTVILTAPVATWTTTQEGYTFTWPQVTMKLTQPGGNMKAVLGMYTESAHTMGTFTSPDYTNVQVQGALTMFENPTTVTQPINLAVTTTTTVSVDPVLRMHMTNPGTASTIAWLASNWDYHIPFMLQGSHSMGFKYGDTNGNSSNAIWVHAKPKLIKVPYIPAVVNVDELAVTTYQMVSALFSNWFSTAGIRGNKASYNKV